MRHTWLIPELGTDLHISKIQHDDFAMRQDKTTLVASEEAPIVDLTFGRGCSW